MIRVALVGALGRMGKEIIKVLMEDPKFELSYAVVLEKEDSDPDFMVTSLLDIDPRKVDVLIDFSVLQNFEKTIHWCVQQKIPFVSGTTGIQNQHFELLKNAANTIPVLWAPNMSLGVALVNEMIKSFRVVKGFDFQVEDFHHNKKVDAPSGTAKHLQNTLEDAIGRPLPDVVAVRGGGIFGIHKIWAMSDEETIMVEHTALNRTVFARGAVKAAGWIKDQSPGQYHMKDVLGLQ